MTRRLPAAANDTGGPSTLARIADALQAPRFILFYLGFYAGCMFTVALAIVWSKVLS